MRNFLALLLAPLLFLTACCDDWDSSDCDCDVEPRPVSIEVEVYDPVTNFVWEDMPVRIVEADQEWSGLTSVSPYSISLLTDSTGRVLLDAYVLADASVGFLEDGYGRAVLGANFEQDQATVVLEVSSPGFTPVIVVVPLRWDQPDVFVAVPFN